MNRERANIKYWLSGVRNAFVMNLRDDKSAKEERYDVISYKNKNINNQTVLY